MGFIRDFKSIKPLNLSSSTMTIYNIACHHMRYHDDFLLENIASFGQKFLWHSGAENSLGNNFLIVTLYY